MSKYRVRQINSDCYIIETYRENIGYEKETGWWGCDEYGDIGQGEDDIVRYYREQGLENAKADILFWTKNEAEVVLFESGENEC